MSLSADLIAEDDRHAGEVARIKHLLQVQLNLLPDNPCVNRLSDNCYSMSSKDLGATWSAEYHDFKYQYRALIKLCDTSTDIRKSLFKALKEQMFKVGDVAVKLHPEVIKNVRQVLV